MEHIQESQILLDEDLCKNFDDREVQLDKATIFFKENVRLVYSVVKYFSKPIDPAWDIEDILQTGFEGLWIACNRFDETTGNCFSTYAIPVIRGRIMKYLYNQGTGNIRTPRYFHEISHHLRALNIEEPIDKKDMKLLIAIGFSEKQIQNYRSFQVISLDMRLSDKSSSTMLDIIPDDSIKIGGELSEEELEGIIDILVSRLPFSERDKKLLEEWMYIEIEGARVTGASLGRKYNISQSSTSRLIRKCKEYMREHKEEVLQLFGYV